MRIPMKVAGLSCRPFSVAWGSLPQFALNSTDVAKRGAGGSASYEFNLSQPLTVDLSGFFAASTLTQSHHAGSYYGVRTLFVSTTVFPGDPVIPLMLPIDAGYGIARATGETDP
jgi:hypothetical protein